MIHSIKNVMTKITAMKQKSLEIEKAIKEGKHPEEIKFMTDELKQLGLEVASIRVLMAWGESGT